MVAEPLASNSPSASWSIPIRTKFIMAGASAAGFALSVVTAYPGYMTNDATYVHSYIEHWSLGDWQSPLMTILWWLIDPIAPGPGSMFLLTVALYWLGFGLIGYAVARRSLWLGILVQVLALTPPAFILLAMIWRDVLFATIWLLAAAIVYVAADWRRGRWPFQAIALLLVAFGILLRPNSIIAAPLIAVYILWPDRFDWKRTALLYLPGLALGFGLIEAVYYGVLDVKREHPAHSLMMFDLGGITHFTGENQFPVTWNAQENALLTSKCYDPEHWDSYWTIKPCDFVMARIEGQEHIFGTPRLTEAWQRAVLAHPLAYLMHRATFLWTFLAGSNLTLELFKLTVPNATALGRNSLFRVLIAVHDVLKATPLFRLGSWLLLALAIIALAWRRRASRSGAFAIGVCASGAAYALSFFPLGVAADFRYGYWCVLAALAAIVPACIARPPG